MQISQAEQKRLNKGLHAAPACVKQVIMATLVLPGPQREPASHRNAFFIALPRWLECVPWFTKGPFTVHTGATLCSTKKEKGCPSKDSTVLRCHQLQHRQTAWARKCGGGMSLRINTITHGVRRWGTPTLGPRSSAPKLSIHSISVFCSECLHYVGGYLRCFCSRTSEIASWAF